MIVNRGCEGWRAGERGKWGDLAIHVNGHAANGDNTVLGENERLGQDDLSLPGHRSH